MRRLIYCTLLIAGISACKFREKEKTVEQPAPALAAVVHPAWIKQGNIYEVNVRQYTKEGTFNAFAKHLDRLKAMGVQTLWFMPITPISRKDRKETLGSYYAVADYNAINPEFGDMQDWQNLVAAIHARGMKVMIDWVPNHTGADHPWLKTHPDFYVKDSSGNAATMFDWTDTRVLNYSNAEMQDSMIAAMKFWVKNSSLDGYRVDVAWNVPVEFWVKAIPQLKQLNKDLFFLAEGDKPYLLSSGFDAFYPWEMFHMMEKVAAGQRPAFALDSVKFHYDSAYVKTAIPMYFTSNHDENSWNKADYGTFPGAVHAPFAVFSQTMAATIPLIYSGQEEPVLRAVSFFNKDAMSFGKFARASFYTTLLKLRNSNPALSIDAGFRKVAVGDENAIYAYVREKDNRKVLVILNLTGKEQPVTVKEKELHGKPLNVFMGTTEPLTDASWKMEPWGYVVYDYQ